MVGEVAKPHRTNRLSKWAVAGCAIVALGSMASACGGANERRPTNNAAPAAPGAPSAPAAPVAPASVTAPTNPPDPKCGPITNFQLWNFSAGSVDLKKNPEAKDGIIKGLEDSSSQASTAVPELAPSLKVVVSFHKANLNGQPGYTPGPGEPSVEDAGKKLFDWAKEKSC